MTARRTFRQLLFDGRLLASALFDALAVVVCWLALRVIGHAFSWRSAGAAILFVLAAKLCNAHRDL